PFVMVVNPSVPAKTVAELAAYAKANPGKISFGSPGIGTPGHVAGELFKIMAGVDMVHVPYRGGGAVMSDLLGVSGVYFQRATGTRFQFVPYRGGGPAVQDEVAGHVDLMFNEATGALPYVLSRQIKTYAVLAKTRWFAAPEIPTSEELGVPGI